MLEDVYYLSGILVNMGIAYTLFKIIPRILEAEVTREEEKDKKKVLIRNEEEGELNLHSSQSVKSLLSFEKKTEDLNEKENDKEKKIEDRLKSTYYDNYVKWTDYISYVVGKKKIN